MNKIIKIKDRTSAGNRIAEIASRGEVVFHSGDLANLWGIQNKSTLNKTLLRYAARKFIYRIYKGLYALKKIEDIDPFFLGIKAIHGPAYVSCESALYEFGILNQPPKEITLVSSFSRHFKVDGYKYRSRKMKDDFLYNDIGIEVRNGIRIASVARAVADMLYFNPRKYFDAWNSGLIDRKEVKNIIDAMGYKIKLPKHEFNDIAG
ncbi:hypothetical protein C4572_00905 [Candidatus Parcubacteria bacterium]|nr:MAG: hypothetical protein C4572_00905 [Candidatus Parcubacteria bacterium]